MSKVPKNRAEPFLTVLHQGDGSLRNGFGANSATESRLVRIEMCLPWLPEDKVKQSSERSDEVYLRRMGTPLYWDIYLSIFPLD